MKVYIVQQEWQSRSGEHETNILRAFDSAPKAYDFITELYHEDILWLEEQGIEIASTSLSEDYSEVANYDDGVYSINSVTEIEVL